MAVLYNLLNVNQIYVTNFTINTLYTDFWSRLISLDFFTNNYYYFWTAFYFLYCLLLLVVIFFMTQTFMVFTNHYLFLLLLSTYILFLKLDYFYINTSFLEIKMSFENFNILLLNSTNKYHPGMLYLSFMALVILLLKKPSLVVTFYHSNWTRLRLGCLFSDYYFFFKKTTFFFVFINFFRFVVSLTGGLVGRLMKLRCVWGVRFTNSTRICTFLPYLLLSKQQLLLL